MSSSQPFDAEKIISLWTQLLQLQVDIGYYENDDSISFPPVEGRIVDEVLCEQLGLSDEVIALLKHLPCPSTFSGAYDTPILDDSMAVPFTDNEWIRNSRDPERCWTADDDEPLRLDFMKSEDLALVLTMDEPGRHLILDTEAGTARFYDSGMMPFDSWEEDKFKCERPDSPMHYRNYPCRPAVEVLEDLVAKFRNLECIPMRYKGSWPQLLTAQYDEDKGRPNIYTNAKILLQREFGWPDNFNKDDWNRQREAIWKRLDDPISARLTDSRPLHMYIG